MRVVSPYIGGGFGGKLFLRADALLAALGARAAKRPVKVALSRPLMANNSTHRPATIQRVRLGATPDGKITAFAHETWSGNLPGGSAEMGILASRALYAGANRMTATRLATLDLPEGNAMRAPGDAPGSMAFEMAIDEMAQKLKLDPVEFRVLNDTQQDPEKPDASVFHAQARRMPAHRRGEVRLEPAQRAARQGARRRAGSSGMGVATAYRGAPVLNSAARVRLDAQGVVTVETDMTDIGTGSYTIIQQTAAEMMGVPLERVVVKLGDSAFPGLGRLGRAVRRRERHFRRVRRLREIARGHCAEAGRRCGHRRIHGRRGRRGRQACAARPGGRRAGPRRRRQDRVRERLARNTCTTPSARTSSKSRSIR